jgi:hypothetical protein
MVENEITDEATVTLYACEHMKLGTESERCLLEGGSQPSGGHVGFFSNRRQCDQCLSNDPSVIECNRKKIVPLCEVVPVP